MTLGGLFKAAGIGASLARSEVKAAMRRAARQAAFAIVVVSLLVLAFGFGLGAFAVWLSHEIGTVRALAFIALGFVVLALIAYIIWQASGRGASRRRRGRSPIAEALNLDRNADGEEPPQGSVLGSLAVVALVGYLLGRQIFRR